MPAGTIPDRMTTRASQWLIGAVLAGGLLAPNAPAQNASPTEIDGVYNGSYAGDKGPTKLKLTLTTQQDGTLVGVFTLYLPEGSGTTAYTCHMDGRYIPGRAFQLIRPKWETAAPKNLNMFGINGTFDAAAGQGAGKILGKLLPPGPDYEATRDTAESASMPTVIAAEKAAKAFSPTTINGVYIGTYQRSDGNKKLKFSIKSTEDGSLTGLFTFDLPGYVGASVTYKLTGRYVAGAKDYGLASSPFQFTTVEPMGSLALDTFDASKVKAVHVGITGPGSIVGSLTGLAPGSGVFNCGWLNATRDKAQSANLDSVMAAQASPAGIANTGAPAAPVARLTSINGVYNGTYTGPEGPTKFKLTIMQLGQGALGGTFTVYLTSNSVTQAYTYSLEGSSGQGWRFQLDPRDWDTVPPTNFEKRVIQGTFVPNLSQNTATISGVMGGTGFPKFEATWDATESTNIPGAIAAQKAVGPPAVPPLAPSVVAARVAAHAEALKTAPPAQLASKDLVRKSKAYWDAYQTDIIRQIFDGGFGSDVDDDQQFKILFCAYVELFSKKCRAWLPANHETVTVTQFTDRKWDDNGNLVSQNSQSATVEVDSRFAAKYREFSEYLGSSKNGLGPALAVMSGKDSLSNMLAPGLDMRKFFATETGSSAAMHQLGENLLRGATGERSLQDVGGTIAGAAAETDKNLPPGRFTHLVDACNVWLRDPENAKYRTGNDTAYCQCLGEKEEDVMTFEEVYYYANDFGGRVWRGIAQPKEYCTDPAWPRLHPPLEDCRQ
jgi:uncharacterized protein with FMN-binding domain